jgi:hypothetical protein
VPLTRLYRFKWVLIILPIALLALATMVWLWRSYLPMPPSQITLTAGLQEGAYYAHAQQYQARFAAQGIELKVLTSNGSDENILRLQHQVQPHADLAFVQSSGLGAVYSRSDEIRLESLGNVDIEPIWIFSRQNALDGLTQLRGLRVSLGPAGSGNRRVALSLLEQVSLTQRDIVEVPLSGLAAAEALRKGQLDAMFWVSGVQSPVVQLLLQAPGVYLAQLRHTAALTERLVQLQPRLLPQDAIDPVKRLPPRDTVLLTAATSLVARNDLDPALQRLTTQIAREVHGGGGVFHRVGTYPSLRRLDYPASNQARNTLAQGLPWLEQVLPFWWAQVVKRLLLICFPVALLALWLATLTPAYLRWLLESRVARWYGELKYIENDLSKALLSGLEKTRYLRQLDDMERKVTQSNIPDYLMARWYLLRVHIGFVRGKLAQQLGR